MGVSCVGWLRVCREAAGGVSLCHGLLVVVWLDVLILGLWWLWWFRACWLVAEFGSGFFL